METGLSPRAKRELGRGSGHRGSSRDHDSPPSPASETNRSGLLSPSTQPRPDEHNNGLRYLKVGFWILALVLGGTEAWITRHAMNPDGIVYLDLSDACLRRDWSMVINGCYNPLYPGLLGLARVIANPSPYSEFPLVHLVNFGIYLGALASFEFFLHHLTVFKDGAIATAAKKARVTFPAWAWVSLSYAAFLWAVFGLVTVWKSTPDMCIALVIFLACGIILRIRSQAADWKPYAFLGIVLGFGYLTKAVIFPLAMVFLLLNLFPLRHSKSRLRGLAISLMLFCVISGPFIVALSASRGRFTIGDAGRLNYFWFVNGGTRFIHWQGGSSDNGIPLHPTRRIFDKPAVYEFGTPFSATYPPAYDPSYWYEGMTPHFDLWGQLHVLVSSMEAYWRMIKDVLPGLVVMLLMVLYGMRKQSTWISDVFRCWPLVLPAITALGMYSVTHVEPRYVGPFMALLFVTIMASIWLPDSPHSRRVLWSCAAVMLITMTVAVAGLTAREWKKAKTFSTLPQRTVVEALNQGGVHPGDRVASIGYAFGASWARLARVRIVAEITTLDANDFWTADSSVRSRAIEAFKKTGAKVIVTDTLPAGVSDARWKQIGANYYAYFLQE
jgi:hypothetical protein